MTVSPSIFLVRVKTDAPNSVGRPEVMSFSGALDAKGARKGIFITTSHFPLVQGNMLKD